MSTLETTAEQDLQAIEDARRLRRIKILTPIRGGLNGAGAVFDGYYLTYFFTDIYNFPVVFTGVLSIVSVLVSWVFAPAFAAFVDRFNFKKSKIYPWMIIGSSIGYIGHMIVMSLPAFNIANASVLAPIAFGIIIIARIGDQISRVPATGISPIISKTAPDRQYLAQAGKIGHEAGKTIWGYIIPLFLGSLTAVYGDVTIAFAIAAVILFVLGWADPIIFALFGVKGSYIEREAMRQTQTQERVTLKKMLKVLFTNRPVLGMFLFFTLHKICFFIYIIYGISAYDHLFGQAEAVGPFFTVFSSTAIFGVFCGRLWTRIFKESKRSCTMAMVVHIAFTLIIAVTFNKIPIPLFLVFFAVSSFFMGMLETWVTPLYTACAEYGSWKTGVTMNALVMSTASLTVSTAIAMPPVLATILLRPDTYKQNLTFLFAWVPLILAVASILCLTLIYNLNDNKIRKIQDDLAAGKTQATSDLKL